MPPNTVSVARPGPHGNPFKVGVDGTAAECVALFTADIENKLRKQNTKLRARLDRLRGKNLACFCGPDEPCHADVLLHVANK